MRFSLALTLLPLFAACNTSKAVHSEPGTAAHATDFQVFALEHAQATELAVAIEQLCYDAAPSRSSEFKFLADTRTNSLLVMAPDKHMENIKSLISVLDVEAKN